MLATIRPSLVLIAIFTAVCGLAYPVLVTGIVQIAVPRQANGSLTERDGVVVGSELIGQTWTDPRHFWGRPSATSPAPNNAMSSSGSNLGPTNPALKDAVQARVAAFANADAAAGVVRASDDHIPIDLITSSASGLDPDISPEAAAWQAPRVARARGLDEAKVRALVEAHVIPRTVGIWGEPRVNVLELNHALDALGGLDGHQ